MHHHACWDGAGRCGSYICAPARRESAAGPGDSVLRISPEELQRADPLAARRGAAMPAVAPATVRRWNRLAIASLACAVAGIPLFGALTGLVAITLGSLALGALRTSREKGTAKAVAGVLLGLADVVGWVVLLVVMLSSGAPALRTTDLSPDLATLDDLNPAIARGMRANVLISRHRGWFGGSIGSGVILKIEAGEALVLTNRHVVDPNFADDKPGEQAEGKGPGGDLEVVLVDQSVQHGVVVWQAPDGVDLALVRADCPTPKARAARWRLHRKLRVGNPVFAIGNPHGLGWTHTEGTVSQFRLQDVGGRRLRVIQTQTSLNPGNSGGGLYDREGYLIGIATWSQDKRVSEGLNFALALDSLAQFTIPGLELKGGPAEDNGP